LHILTKSITTFTALTAFMAGISMVAVAQDQQARTAIQKKLESEYALTKTTADKTDIVTAGAVITLNKDKLLMTLASSASSCTNTYKDGKFAQNTGCKANDVFRRFQGLGHSSTTRVFVAGEKFWVTKIDVKDEGKDSEVVLEFFTDAINDVRFRSSLVIPFKDGLPSPEEALKLVQEVVTAAPAEDAKQGNQQSQPASAPAPAPAPAAAAAPLPIPPPPPPPDEPPAAPATVSLGQTPDQVAAILGQPLTKAKAGAKEIYSYKDLKVIFVNGKVKDIQ
jgi:hypothetical protein